MGDTFKKVQRGQRMQIPAEAYNAFVDAVRGHRSRQHDLLQDAGDEFRQSTIIKVKNDTGQDLDRFAVLAVDDPIVSPTDNLQQFKNQVNLKGVVPTDASQYFCVLLEPLAANAIGRAVVSGATPVRVNIRRETDSFAEIEPNATGNLQSTKSGKVPILWKESGTGIKWAVVLLWSGDDSLVAFELASRVETVDDFPADAYLLDADGNRYGDMIQVWTVPIIAGVYGPADIGFRGWATKLRGSGGEWYMVVHMQRFAQYIEFNSADFTKDSEIPCVVQGYPADSWHGEDPLLSPDWDVWVDASHYTKCECLGSNAIGVAVLDEQQSLYPNLVYRVIDTNQMLLLSSGGACQTDLCKEGDATRTLVIADGLTVESADCSDDIPCPKILKADGLTVEYLECDSTPEEPSENDTSDDNIRSLKFREPFVVDVDDECPANAEITLPSNLIVGGTCIDVSQAGCRYVIDFDESCLVSSGSILPGTCIQVNDHGNGTVTINNTMTLTAGPGIAISGNCDKTISTTGVDTGIEEGTCISFDVSGDTTTINSDVNILGGNGIIVTKQDCDYVVSLAGSQGDPKTSIRFVCDVQCVESSGQYQLVIKYGTLELPAAIISSYSDECGGSGSGSGSGGNGGNAEAITFEGIDCDLPTPHFAFTLNKMPLNADYYKMTVTGDKGSSATVGPSYDHEEEEGQTYWGALNDGWGIPQAGECFLIQVSFYDADDNPLGDPLVWEGCCD